MAKRRGILQELAKIAPSGKILEKQIENLIAQKKYAKAIQKLQQSLKREPNQTLDITEAEIWFKQGQYELEQSRYLQAEFSFQNAIALGSTKNAYYWLAKCFLAQGKNTAALELLQTAFDDKTLSKELGGCYLKLLMLNSKSDVVETLIKKQPKRFAAPHLHWARGALALNAGDFTTAVAYFKKMGQQASPQDNVTAWEVYANQRAGLWTQAGNILGLNQPWFKGTGLRTIHHKPKVLQRLIFFQVAHGDRSEQPWQDWSDLAESDLPQQYEAWALELVSLVRDESFHDAAHQVLELPAEVKRRYPELNTLYRPIMVLGGDQAFQEKEMACAATFLETVAQKPTLDPQLALRLHHAFNQSKAFSQDLKLLHQLLSWVQKEAKRTPQDWPEAKLNSTQALLYCWLSDSQMATRKYLDADRSVQKAVQLAPQNPDVVGRQGLSLFSKGNVQNAIPLLTQALELGCKFNEVYLRLVDCLEREEDSEALKSIRRKFGKSFGDQDVDAEVNIPLWVEALGFRNYDMLDDFVMEQKKHTPPLKALLIFLDCAEDDPSSGQKISLAREQAMERWDELLRSHSPSEQVEILKVIYLVIQQHAKRNKKGITALQGRYAQQLVDLIPEASEANQAHLTLLPLQKLSEDRLAIAVNTALKRERQPGKALALAQLDLHHFEANSLLRPFIETQLKQDPQNPLLLLAKATLYPVRSRDYKTFYDQGFDIARRLQDATTLNAYREEEWFESQEMTRRFMGSAGSFGDPSSSDIMEILQRIAKDFLGKDVPPEVLEKLLPELMNMKNRPNGFFDMDDDDDDDDDDGFFFLPPRKRQKSAQKKRKRWFEL